ncbi:hypothetical protein I3760_09G138500 [Carya illinoinensis]|nr:hypothetical protein I3760_09G138500 [Carya illinoinensis]
MKDLYGVVPSMRVCNLMKKFCTFIPFNQSARDFCLYEISSIRVIFSSSATTINFLALFSFDNPISASLSSNCFNSVKSLSRWSLMFPKTSKFHFLRSFFKAVSFPART